MSKLHFARHLEYVPYTMPLCGRRIGSMTSLPEKVTCLDCQKYATWQEAMKKYQQETVNKVIPIRRKQA